MGLTLTPLDYVLTDTQKSFVNSFREVFKDIYSYKTIRWFYCIWHVIEAVQRYLDQSGLQNYLKVIIKKHFFYLLYARSYQEFMLEEEKLKHFFNFRNN